MFLLIEDKVVLLFDGGGFMPQSMRFLVGTTGIKMELTCEGDDCIELDIPEEVSDFLLLNKHEIIVCIGEMNVAKAVSVLNFDRDSLLKKIGAWELLLELKTN